MPENRSMAGQNAFAKREAVAGVAETTGFVGWPGIRLKPGWDGDRDLFRGGGGKVVTSTIGTDENSPWDTEIAACFNHLGLVLASRFGLPVTTTPGGGTNSRKHVFTINPAGEDTFASYTVLWGDGYITLQGVYGFFNNFTLDIDRGEVSVESDFISRAAQFGTPLPTNEKQTITITGGPSGGGMTLTLPFAIGGSVTTASITWNAIASAVKSAIVATGKFDTDEVAVTGGPGPGTPWVVEFMGRYAQTNLALMTKTDSFTGGTAPASAITETTPGAKPTDMLMHPMAANLWDVFIDPSWATLGATKYGGAYEASAEFGDKMDLDAPLNSSIISYERPVEKEEQDDTLDLTIRLGTTAKAQAANMAQGVKQFIRLELDTSRGANPYYIEAAIPFIARLDMCVELVSRGQIDTAPNSGVVVAPFSFVLTKDPVTGNYAQFTLQNDVLTYS